MRVIAFSNKCLLVFCSHAWERIFWIYSSGAGEPWMLAGEQTTLHGEEMAIYTDLATLLHYMASVMGTYVD